MAGLACDKDVGVSGRDAATGTWAYDPGAYGQTVPGTCRCGASRPAACADRFVLRDDVAGTTYWDNNFGRSGAAW